MATLNPYLTFDGNTREAMNFYKECLGGELEIIVVGESPVADQIPPDMKDMILHSSLKSNGLELMATDMQPEALNVGNDVHMCLGFPTLEETQSHFDKLAAGGKVNQPLHEMFFGFIGELTDKFGKRWILVCDKR